MTDRAPPAGTHGARPAGPPPPVTPVDARRALEVWRRLVRDEAVYRAFLARRHHELAGPLHLDGDELAVLDQFAARPGTRWNVDNIRFRATVQVGVRLEMWIPLTVRLLTGGNEEWLRDLVYEYLVHHEWDDLGPYALTECERFAGFVRERVVQRRTFDARLDPVLTFELAVVRALKRTRDVPAAEWPALPWPSASDDELMALRPRRGPVVELVELALDLTPWLETPDPSGVVLRHEPTMYLVYVPSLTQPHRVQTIADGARALLDECTGEHTIADIAAAFEDDHGIEPAAVRSVLRRWLTAGALRT